MDMNIHSSFESSILSYDKSKSANKNFTITPQEFDKWIKEYTFQALWGLNLARAFCNRFQLTDYILWYTKSDSKEILSYIQKNYVSTTV